MPKPPATPPGVHLEPGSIWRSKMAHHPLLAWPRTIVVTKVETQDVFAESVPSDGKTYTQSVRGFMHDWTMVAEALPPPADMMRPAADVDGTKRTP